MEMLWRLPAACSKIEKKKRKAPCGVDVIAAQCDEAVGRHLKAQDRETESRTARDSVEGPACVKPSSAAVASMTGVGSVPRSGWDTVRLQDATAQFLRCSSRWGSRRDAQC